VYDKTKTHSVDIRVDKSFHCPVSSSDESSELIDLIQMSYKDIKKLIGDASLLKFQPGYAQVL
jgi:hypothetical protein